MENESFQSNSKIREIHFGLIEELITHHIGNDRNKNSFTEWKLAFEEKIVDTPVQSECSVLANFNYLKKKGLLKVGKYETLREIFYKNEGALSAINLASKKIGDILESLNMDRNLLNGRPMTGKILIEVEHGDIDVVKNLVLVLHEMLIDSHEIFQSLSPTETGLKILCGEESTENYSDFTQRIKNAHEKLGSILLKYGEKNQSENYSKNILKAFFRLLSSMEKDFGAKDIDINWDNSIMFTVNFASTKLYGKAVDENRESLKEKVKDDFDKIFEIMGQCKGEEKQAHHRIHRIIIY